MPSPCLAKVNVVQKIPNKYWQINTCAVIKSSVLSESSEIDVQAIIAHSIVTKLVGTFNRCPVRRMTNGLQVFLSKNYPV